jgi:ABC-type polysaccharide/polyol phosphate transport system ATPase subunit
MPAIDVSHVTKEFQLGQIEGLLGTLRRPLYRIRGKEPPKRPVLKALDDISLRVEDGEVVGIIGANGAGKSTLLKLISRISVPTQGTIAVKGTIAPLIEVGAGLHPELTGRENVFLNGSILGLSRRDVASKLDEIVEFAELEPFIDTPVKRYSSGMKVRLGFAVATSVEADILIVDEVLAVGDLAFQRKCFDRLGHVIKRSGKTVLIVSHNIRQVERLCSRVVLMERGHLELDGETSKVCSAFYDRSNEKILVHQKRQRRRGIGGRVKSSGEIELTRLRLESAGKGVAEEGLAMGAPLTANIEFTASQAVPGTEIILGIHTTDFVYVTAASSLTQGPIDLEPGPHQVSCTFVDLPLRPGVYAVRLAFMDTHGRVVWSAENMSGFRVVPGPSASAHLADIGLVDLPAEWSLTGNGDATAGRPPELARVAEGVGG